MSVRFPLPFRLPLHDFGKASPWQPVSFNGVCTDVSILTVDLESSNSDLTKKYKEKKTVVNT